VDSSGAEGDSSSSEPSISADGQIVAFYSDATNLVASDANGAFDVFVHDRVTGITERVSLDSSGAEGNDPSYSPSISADGQVVAFYGLATNLVAGDTNASEDAFVHDRVTGITERVSVDSSGVEGNDFSRYPSISADGRVVTFWGLADNLVAGDTNQVLDVFVHERCSIDATWTNYGAGFPGTNGVPSLTSRNDPELGAQVTLDLANSYGDATLGLFFLGFQRAQIHSSWGGDLLLVPALTFWIDLPSDGATITGDIPDDTALCGTTVDLQAIEADPGAAKGVSFTPGLELVLGH
jgi:Tol biopolymer transport system component